MNYEFEIELDVDRLTDDLVNKIYDACYNTCDDLLVSQQYGKITVDFIREADSYEEAVKNAQEDLIKAGIPIKK